MKDDDKNIDIVKKMISAIGDNPNRSGLKDTPRRVVRMWDEIFRGYDKKNKPSLTVFDNNSDGIMYDQMIVDSGYFFHSVSITCYHFLVDIILLTYQVKRF